MKESCEGVVQGGCEGSLRRGVCVGEVVKGGLRGRVVKGGCEREVCEGEGGGGCEGGIVEGSEERKWEREREKKTRNFGRSRRRGVWGRLSCGGSGAWEVRRRI